MCQPRRWVMPLVVAAEAGESGQAGHVDVGTLLVVAAEPVEQLVGLGVDGGHDPHGGLADQLTREVGDTVHRVGDRQAVPGPVPVRIMRAVVVEEFHDATHLGAPLLERGALRQRDEFVLYPGDGVGDARVARVGQYPRMVHRDPPVHDRLIDGVQRRTQRPSRLEVLTSDTARRPSFTRQP
jgi:hypothetical protein